MKEPKEKHVIFILECLKGKHLELIRPKEALKKLSDRFFTNLRSISLMIKALIILHRALQEEDISQTVAHKIKEMENILKPCQNDDQSYDIKMQCFISDLYINYIKNLINFIIISQLFQISLKDLHHYSQSLKLVELFLIFNKIDTLIDGILKVFQQKTYCQNYRLFHSVIYLLFVDLLKIYQSYYLLITVMLEKFEEMELKDAKRAFIVYLSFIKVNREIRKMAAVVISEFNIKLKLIFYEIDTKVVEALKLSIEVKERKLKKESRDAGSVESSMAFTTNASPLNAAQKIQVEKIEYLSETKRFRRNSNMMLDMQGVQGDQQIFEKDDFANVQRTATVDFQQLQKQMHGISQGIQKFKSATVKKVNLINQPLLEQIQIDPIRTKMDLQFLENEKILKKYNQATADLNNNFESEDEEGFQSIRIQDNEILGQKPQLLKVNSGNSAKQLDMILGLKKFKSNSDRDLFGVKKQEFKTVAQMQYNNHNQESAIKINLSDDEGFKSVVIEDIFEENKLQSMGNNERGILNSNNNYYQNHGRESFFDLDSFLLSKDNKENKNTFNLQSSMNIASYVNPQSSVQQSIKFFSEDILASSNNGGYNHQEDESFQSCKEYD